MQKPRYIRPAAAPFRPYATPGERKRLLAYLSESPFSAPRTRRDYLYHTLAGLALGLACGAILLAALLH